MEIKIQGISIKKLDAFREIAFPIQLKKETQISVNINIGVIDIKKTDDGKALIKANYNLDILDIGHIGAQLDVLAEVDELDNVISYWQKTIENKQLPEEVNIVLHNAVFYYVMPIIISMAEKMTIPMPIPPLRPPPQAMVKPPKK